MNTSPANTQFKRPAKSTVLPQRKPPLPQQPQRQPFQVLQTGRSPAQLSLFLRPGL